MTVSCSVDNVFFTFSSPADVVAVKGSGFPIVNSSVTQIFQRALLCAGDEGTLLDCMAYEGGSGRMCPSDHSEDAGVKCGGRYLSFQLFIITPLSDCVSFSLPFI